MMHLGGRLGSGLAVWPDVFLNAQTAMKTYKSNARWANFLCRKSLLFRIPNTPYEAMMKDTLLQWYGVKHSRVTPKCVEFINSFVPLHVPGANQPSPRRTWKGKSEIQRYRCSECGRGFTPTTGTLLDSWKIPFLEWIEFIGYSFITLSRFNRNADSTRAYWLIKTLEPWKNAQDFTVISNRVYIDETYIHVVRDERIMNDSRKSPKGLSVK